MLFLAQNHSKISEKLLLFHNPKTNEKSYTNATNSLKLAPKQETEKRRLFFLVFYMKLAGV